MEVSQVKSASNGNATTFSPASDRSMREQMQKTLIEEQTVMQGIIARHSPQDLVEADSQVAYFNEISASIDRVLQAGDWDESLFLRSTVKPVRELRAQVIERLDDLQGLNAAEVQGLDLQIAEDEQLVYVTLFQSKAQDIKRWAMQVRGLERYIVGRAIYSDVEHVDHMISRRQDPSLHAYIILVVKKESAKLSAFKAARQDKHGHELLTLQAGALSLNAIKAFVHNGKTYRWIEGQLVG